jgi:hypothetical protein
MSQVTTMKKRTTRKPKGKPVTVTLHFTADGAGGFVERGIEAVAKHFKGKGGDCGYWLPSKANGGQGIRDVAFTFPNKAAADVFRGVVQYEVTNWASVHVA